MDEVKVTIDGKEIIVPKGMNLIEAARLAGVEIPHYCYHPHLSIAGNCRMCQVEITGAPKLGIACNTGCTEGMNVKTHVTSPQVAEAQRATLEFLLINHPLDCTICDAAGHCKLQDYYYQYNHSGSRFIEEKVNKIKAEVLGPEVIYDGERCIMCTRCVRFCDEITKTSELAGYNRGDRGLIGVAGGKELDNPLSGTVVDLCPVGALTHRRWRFNSRIWYTSQIDTICPGCSTGCNIKVAMRDDVIVQVKARRNDDVNKEWLCDRGRYGLSDHLSPPATDAISTKTIIKPSLEAFKIFKQVEDKAVVLISPYITLEEMWVSKIFAEKFIGIKNLTTNFVLAYESYQLTEVEKVLVSPDLAPNARGLEFIKNQNSDTWRESVIEQQKNLLKRIFDSEVEYLVVVGGGIPKGFNDLYKNIKHVILITDDNVQNNLSNVVVYQGRSILEKNGTFVNQDRYLQRVKRLVTPKFGTSSDWEWLVQGAKFAGVELDVPKDERLIFFQLVEKLGLQNKSGKNISLGDLGSQGLKTQLAGLEV